MPHYANGVEAQIGDRVKGKGYNVKDENGELKEITGVLVGLTRGETCNVKVAHLCPGESTVKTDDGVEHRAFVPNSIHLAETAVAIGVEYGQADHFVKVD